MFSRIGSAFLLLIAVPGAATAAGWNNTQYGVAIDSFPSGWTARTADTRVRLEKEFNKDGYGFAYDESITCAISIAQSTSLADAGEQMARQGYLLQERGRVQMGDGTVPLWIFFHQANQQEVSWVAIVLRAGLAYTFEVRGTPLDRGLLADFKSVLAAFRFLPDARQEAWTALEAKDASRALRLFEKLVRAESADGNALYGLGLAELALGRSKDALADLKRADAIIGLGEVRSALGQAYLQVGDPVRALTTWYQAIQDDPASLDDLRPSIEGALARARVSDDRLSAERRLVWEDFAFLAGVVSMDLQDSLNDARSDEFDLGRLPRFEDINDRCRLLFSELLRHLIFEGGSEVEAHYLAAAFTFREAIQEAIEGLRGSNLVLMEEAELRLLEGLEAFWAASPRLEISE